MKNAQWFSKKDLDQGYYQVSLSASDRKYTAFSTPNGKYELKRLAFGLKNAPKFFQKMNEKDSERN